MSGTSITTELQKYGVTSESIRLFTDDKKADSLNYLDLINPVGKNSSKDFYPDGIAEYRQRPLLYFIDESRLLPETTEQSNQLKQMPTSTSHVAANVLIWP